MELTIDVSDNLVRLSKVKFLVYCEMCEYIVTISFSERTE